MYEYLKNTQGMNIIVWLFLIRGYGASGMIRFFPNKFFAGEKSIVIDMKTGRKKDIWTEELYWTEPHGLKRTETDYQLISKEFIVDGVMSFTVSHNQKYLCYSHSRRPVMLHIYDMEKGEERVILELSEAEMEDMDYYDFGISPDDRYIWYTKGLYFSPVESDLRFLFYQTKLYIYSLEEKKIR